jgi:hypothetical protein
VHKVSPPIVRIGLAECLEWMEAYGRKAIQAINGQKGETFYGPGESECQQHFLEAVPI